MFMHNQIIIDNIKYARNYFLIIFWLYKKLPRANNTYLPRKQLNYKTIVTKKFNTSKF